MTWLKSQLALMRHERRAILFLSIVLALLWLRNLSLDRSDKTIESKEVMLAQDSIQTETLNTTNLKTDYKKQKTIESQKERHKKPTTKNRLENAHYENKINSNSKPKYQSVERKQQKLELRDFDPNKIEYQQLTEMGVDKKTANNWVKFVAAGAQFYKPEDVLKIYGMNVSLYEKLIPHIKIEKAAKKQKRNTEIVKIELNSADADLLMQLYGIGPKLSERIIKYRDKLGGFYHLDQLNEVYGIPDTTLQEIAPKLSLIPIISKMNINFIESKELSSHPYISYKTADIIIKFRNQHGPFNSIDDLDKIKIFTIEELKKIKAYLTI